MPPEYPLCALGDLGHRIPSNTGKYLGEVTRGTEFAADPGKKFVIATGTGMLRSASHFQPCTTNATDTL
jgi:hypothetical protein